MWIPLAAAVLFATVVSNIGAPLNPLPQKIHRESTKEILGLEQELKKAAGENKKPRPPAEEGPVPAEALADEELVKELAAHDEAVKDDKPGQSKETDEDSTEEELQQEKAVAEKAAELKAKQEEQEEEDLKDVEKEPESEPDVAQEEEEAQDQEEPGNEEVHDEEELQNLQAPSNINDLYEDYLNEQRQAYYDAKRSYGAALDNLAEQENENKDEFVSSLLETIREHPELLDEMRTGEVEEEEEQQPSYNYNPPSNDQEEALRAEYLAATRGLQEPQQQFESYASNPPYQGSPYEENEIRPPMENFQNYPSDKMAKVVAKKWGYSAPEEYYQQEENQAPLMEESAQEKKDHHEESLDQPQHLEPIM